MARKGREGKAAVERPNDPFLVAKLLRLLEERRMSLSEYGRRVTALMPAGGRLYPLGTEKLSPWLGTRHVDSTLHPWQYWATARVFGVSLDWLLDPNRPYDDPGRDLVEPSEDETALRRVVEHVGPPRVLKILLDELGRLSESDPDPKLRDAKPAGGVVYPPRPADNKGRPKATPRRKSEGKAKG